MQNKSRSHESVSHFNTDADNQSSVYMLQLWNPGSIKRSHAWLLCFEKPRITEEDILIFNSGQIGPRTQRSSRLRTGKADPNKGLFPAKSLEHSFNTKNTLFYQRDKQNIISTSSHTGVTHVKLCFHLSKRTMSPVHDQVIQRLIHYNGMVHLDWNCTIFQKANKTKALWIIEGQSPTEYLWFTD